MVNQSRSWLSQWGNRYFAIDVRSLALLRIGMALVMLGQLATYFPVASEFFSGRGILPAELHRDALDQQGFESAWTLYSISDDANFVAGLMLIHMIVAMWLLLGFFTRISTFVCLVLIWSLQMRNPMITTGGDVLLRCLLAWSLFLPLGRAYSIDSRIDGFQLAYPPPVVSLASAGLILQLVSMYFFAGLAKLNWAWISGDAIQMSLQLEMYVKPIGNWIVQAPAVLLKVGTWGVLIMELAIPLLIFAPRHTNFIRGVAAALFLLLHFGVWLTMSIGIFSVAALVAWLALIPAETWNGVSRWEFRPERPEEIPWNRFESSLFSQVVTGSMLVYMILINIMNVHPATFSEWGYRGLHALGCSTMFVQEFKMFGQPPQWSPSFDYAGETESRHVDLFATARRVPPSKSIYRQMVAQPWRRYHWNLLAWDLAQSGTSHPILEKLKTRLLETHVTAWNEGHSDQVVVSRLVCHLAPINQGPEDRRERREMIWALFP